MVWNPCKRCGKEAGGNVYGDEYTYCDACDAVMKKEHAAQTTTYDTDVRQMKSFDLGSREGGAALAAGAISEETLMEAYSEMDRILRRIREYERANDLPPTKWDYDGSARRTV